MTDSERVDIVIIDANILINLFHIGRLDLLGKLPGYRFLAPEQVIDEITVPAQKQAIQEALQQGWLDLTMLTSHTEIQDYAVLRKTLDRGESACLAAAGNRGCLVACDERGGAFKRAVKSRLGSDAVLRTPDLIIATIHAGLATVVEADEWKAVLERNRFKMRFESFEEMV